MKKYFVTEYFDTNTLSYFQISDYLRIKVQKIFS